MMWQFLSAETASGRVLTTWEQMQNQIIWYNSFIRIKNKVVCKKEWFNKGIIYVKDLYFQNQLLTVEQFNQLYNTNVKFLEYYAIVSTIPREWRMQTYIEQKNENTQVLIKKLGTYEKWSQVIYAQINTTDDAVKNIKEKLSRV